MSDIYFFTDVDLLNDQTAEQAFGPVVGHEDTQYRVTSMHTATANPCAYAVCDGIIKIQDSDLNPDNLVNIILKPSSHQKINGVEIKYFIYRGILKESIVNMSKIDELALNDVYNIDMLTTIWQNQDAYEQNVENNIPCSKILYGEQSCYTKISELFEEDNLNYCDYVCKAGESIGVFHKDCIGFEIIQNTMFTDDSIIMAKSPEHIINVENNEGYSYGEIKAIRDQVLHYIDPVAFYGTQSSVDSNNIPSTKFINNNSIYLNLLSTTGFSLFFYDVIEKVSFNKSNEEIRQSPWPIIKGELNSDLCLKGLNEIEININIFLFNEQNSQFLNLNSEDVYNDNTNDSYCLSKKISFSYATINSKYFKVRFKYSLGIANISLCCIWDNLFFVKEFNISKINFVAFNIASEHYTLNDRDGSCYKMQIFYENERLFFYAYHSDMIFKNDISQLKSISDFFEEETTSILVKDNIKLSPSKSIKILSLLKKYRKQNVNWMILSLNYQEYQNILSLVNTIEWNQFHPIFFQHIPEQQEELEDYSFIPQKYKSYSLRICGLKKDNNIKIINTDIKLYSVVDSFYCSKLNENEYVNYNIEQIREYHEENITFIFNELLINDAHFLPIISKLTKLETFHNICLYLRKVSNESLNITIALYENFISFDDDLESANAFWSPKKQTLHLNKSKLQFHEPVSVIRTCVHEMIHAYISLIMTNFSPEERTLHYPGVQDFYARFKKYKDNTKYMNAQHNHMAYAYRPMMIKAMKEYDAMVGITNRSGNIKYTNLFSRLEESYDYTTEEFYIALSWGGLVRTKNENDKNDEGEAAASWRHLASKNRDEYLKLLVIAYRVQHGAKYCNDGVYDTSKFVNPNVFNL